MADDFGRALKQLRNAAGLSLSALASEVQYDPTYLSYIEQGRRRPTLGVAEACDRVLDTTPFLVLMLTTDAKGESDMARRRAVLGAVGAALAGSVVSDGGFDALMRYGLLGASSASLDEIVEGFERQYSIDRGPEFGATLFAEVNAVRQRIADQPADRDALRAGARLAQLYGLWLGDQGNLPAAFGWYKVTAADLAARSGDPELRSRVEGRAVTRGMFEGLSVREAKTAIGRTLAMKKGACVGALEAHLAAIQLAALTGSLAEGRRAVAAAFDMAEQLPEPDHAATPLNKVALYRNYLECRVGPARDADRAHEAALAALVHVPVWLIDTRIYYALSRVRRGSVADGVRAAYEIAVMPGRSPIRVHAIALRDVLGHVPPGPHGRRGVADELGVLREHASSQPGPWEALR